VRLRILHRTVYEYGEPVTQSFNEARLRPITDETQRCLECQLIVIPQPSVIREYPDFHGNQVYHFELGQSHSRLDVESTAVVETLLSNPFNFVPSINRESLDRTLHQFEFLHEYLLQSPYVPLTPEMWRFAIDAGGGHEDLWKLAVQMTQYIHKNFKYQPGSTHVHTSATQVLRQRLGVCQDYAHVLIGALRSLKIPARYVSGYHFQNRDMPTPTSVNDDLASHAWCEMFLPEVGWRGLDATNGLVVNDHYVKLAVGRDYSDAAPLKGVYRGSPKQQLKVSVKIEDIGPS